MANIDQLILKTNEFFARHWFSDSEFEMPEWKYNWPWAGSVPYHNRGGVYSLFNEFGEVIYIGLGISIGGGAYKEHGISRRLLSHVITTDKEKGSGNYVPQKKWKSVADIGAIGFPCEISYLAASLENFLIRELKPERNNVSKNS